MNSLLNNRELSWLSFNRRVLQEAQDKRVPLIQRLRFLGIYSSNQDEFFKVRVANLERLGRAGKNRKLKFQGNFTLDELLHAINAEVENQRNIYDETYREILEEMEQRGIRVLDEKQLNEQERQFCRTYFATSVSRLLVPLMIRKNSKIPFLGDGRLYYAVKMKTYEPEGKNRYAILEIPRNKETPRFVVLPSAGGEVRIVFIDEIIRISLKEVFFMFDYDEITAYSFKFTRDAELSLDDDLSRNIIEKMEQALNSRKYGRPVRLVYDREMPEDVLEILRCKLGLKGKESVSPGGRYHLMSDLTRFPEIDLSLEYPPLSPVCHPQLKPFSSMLAEICRHDILLHYPYHSFGHLLDFLREAAVDPHTDTIYITLYRLAEDSAVIRTLVNAAKNGKKVVAVVELLARFDEERNLEYAEQLKQAGAKVIYGIDGLKVHSKLILVKRKPGVRCRGYVHVGTGNFNESTARIYSDFALFTANPVIVEEAQQIFDFLQKNYKHLHCKHLLVSPYQMRDRIEEYIETEIKNAGKGKPAYIRLKCNSLTDDRLIGLLYKAGQAGVDIRLIVRGACSIRPGLKGVSTRIEGISIVDRYLEHARLMIFCNGGQERIFISSADWMPRNMDRRVEVGIPVYDPGLRKTLKGVFEIQWNDHVKARNLSPVCLNCYIGSEDGKHETCRSQVALHDFYALLCKKDYEEGNGEQ